MDDGSQITSRGAGAGPGPAAAAPPIPWRESPAAGQGRRSAPDEVWARVREDYLAGLSGPEACRRHGVKLSALRDRAAAEGWRRVDQPWTPPNRLDPWDEGVELEQRVGGDLDKVNLCELWFVAHRRMMRAVMRGDAVEALRWRRVSQAMNAEEAELDRQIAQHEAICAYERDQAEAAEAARRREQAAETDSSDASDGVFTAPGAPPASPS